MTVKPETFTRIDDALDAFNDALVHIEAAGANYLRRKYRCSTPDAKTIADFTVNSGMMYDADVTRYGFTLALDEAYRLFTPYRTDSAWWPDENQRSAFTDFMIKNLYLPEPAAAHSSVKPALRLVDTPSQGEA